MSVCKCWIFSRQGYVQFICLCWCIQYVVENVTKQRIIWQMLLMMWQFVQEAIYTFCVYKLIATLSQWYLVECIRRGLHLQDYYSCHNFHSDMPIDARSKRMNFDFHKWFFFTCSTANGKSKHSAGKPHTIIMDEKNVWKIRVSTIRTHAPKLEHNKLSGIFHSTHSIKSY